MRQQQQHNDGTNEPTITSFDYPEEQNIAQYIRNRKNSASEIKNDKLDSISEQHYETYERENKNKITEVGDVPQNNTHYDQLKQRKLRSRYRPKSGIERYKRKLSIEDNQGNNFHREKGYHIKNFSQAKDIEPKSQSIDD